MSSSLSFRTRKKTKTSTIDINPVVKHVIKSAFFKNVILLNFSEII